MGGTAKGSLGHDFSVMSEISSIRNRLRGTVREIVSDKVVSEVVVETAAGTISAVITTRSVEELNLKVGTQIYAIIKATSVSVERPATLADTGSELAGDGDIVFGHVGGVGG